MDIFLVQFFQLLYSFFVGNFLIWFINLLSIIIQFSRQTMGSTPSVQPKQHTCQPKQYKPLETPQQPNTQKVLKQINLINKTQNITLKSSQSLNIDKQKSDLKFKKVKEIRSSSHLRDVKLKNDQNEQIGKNVFDCEIEQVCINGQNKKLVKQLNPLNNKKIASDRTLISQQSKTQNVLSLIPLHSLSNRNDTQSRSKRCRVSKML